jgi:hypothetical protein
VYVNLPSPSPSSCRPASAQLSSALKQIILCRAAQGTLASWGKKKGIVSSAQGPRRAQMHKTKSGRPFSIQRHDGAGGFSQNRLGKLRRLREGSSAYLRRALDGRWTTRFRFVHLCTAWPLCTGYDPVQKRGLKD